MLAKDMSRVSYEDYISYRGDRPVEYINGLIYDMSPSPNSLHQDISMALSSEIYTYIKSNKGSCKVRTAPYDVVLGENVVIPDISVICDRSKWDEKRCNGAPDWVIEITSTNSVHDYVTKFTLYSVYGVKEYWVINPDRKVVSVYRFASQGNEFFPETYTFNDDISVDIYKGDLVINMSNIME